MAPTIWRLSTVLGPIARFFTAITRGVMRLLGLSAAAGVSAVTEDDIRALAELGFVGGEIEAVEHEIIDALFTLADRPVRDVMTPRVDIASLTMPVTVDDVRERIATTGPLPLPGRHPGDLDHLEGVLYVKDLLQLPDTVRRAAIPSLLRPTYSFPSRRRSCAVLQDMRARRSVFAVVLDEHGGVDGIVTIKDLVTELVGNSQDEYDPGVPSVVLVAPGQWMADGRILDRRPRRRPRRATCPTGRTPPPAGLLMTLPGVSPTRATSSRVDGLTMTVLQMDRNRIDKIRVETVPEAGTIS